MRIFNVARNHEPPDWIDDEAPKEISRGARIALDITLILAVPFCFWAGWFEFHRAREGHWQAWVYAFEWPLFGVIAIWLWKRLRSGNPPKFPKLEPPIFEDEEKKT